MVSRGRDASFIGEVGQEGVDFRHSHIGGIAELVEADIPSGPVHIDAFGPWAIVLSSKATS